MNYFLTFIALAAAFGLSWYSAHSAGRLWTESKIVGGWARVLVIGSLILSGIGFTGVYFMLLLLVGSLFSEPLSALDLEGLLPLSIGMAGVPGVGSVPNLWLNHQVETRRQAFMGAMANAQAAGGGIELPVDPVDVLSGTLDARGLWGWIGDMFGSVFGGGDSGGDSDSGSWVLVVLVLALIVFALFAGVVTTILIVQAADREHVGEIFEMYK